MSLNRRHDENAEERIALEEDAAIKSVIRLERIVRRLLTPISKDFYKNMAMAAKQKIVRLGMTYGRGRTASPHSCKAG